MTNGTIDGGQVLKDTAVGAVGGGLGAGMGKAIGCGANKALKALGGAAVDAATGAGTQVVSNVLEGNPPGEGVMDAAIDSAAGGVGLVAAVQSGCFLPGTSVTLGTGDHQAIETLRIGQRVLTPESVSSVAAGVSVPSGSETKVDPTTWRSYKVSLRDALAESLELEVTLLRPVGWMAEHSRRVAGRQEVWVDFEELNAKGWAEVIEECACPVIEAGPGKVITATITRPNEDVRTLTMSSGEVLYVTGNHRMYSATQRDWVPVKDLRVGEELRTSNGRESVAALGFQRGRHQVYNLEVEDEHCYFVGSGEVLSHNACPVTDTPKNTEYNNGYRTPDGKFASPTGDGARAGADAEQELWDAIKSKKGKDGWSVIEGQVSVRDKSGQLRKYDGAAVSPRGRVIGLEVKSGTASKTADQRRFDSSLSRGNQAQGVGKSDKLKIRKTKTFRR